MSYQNKPGKGAAFKNEKTKDTQPDYKGSFNLDGKDCEIAMWIKHGTKGEFFSISVKEKQIKDDNPF